MESRARIGSSEGSRKAGERETARGGAAGHPPANASLGRAVARATKNPGAEAPGFLQSGRRRDRGAKAGSAGRHLCVLAVLPLVEDVARQRDVALVVEFERRRARCRTSPSSSALTTASNSVEPAVSTAVCPGLDRGVGVERRSLPARCPWRGTSRRARLRRFGSLRGSGEKVISVPSPAGPVIAQYSSVDERVAGHEDRVHALLAHLALRSGRLRCGSRRHRATSIAGLLQLGDERGVVLFAGRVGLVRGRPACRLLSWPSGSRRRGLCRRRSCR